MEKLVSYFSCVAQSHKPQGSLPLSSILFSERVRARVEALRALPYGSEAFSQAKRQMPCYTPSGVFSVRNSEGLIKHSGMLCIEWDKVEDVDALKDLLGGLPFIFYAGLSCSGRGVFALVKIAEPLGSRGLRNDSIDHIVESFRMQASLNPIAKPVAHISLDFSVQDKERLTNRMMMQIADEYLRRMGYGDTQVLIVRHNDREHPHLHLVLNRIDGNSKRISDKNERVRNVKVCRELSDKYGLYIAPNKENVKRHRLREPDKTKYEIYDAIRNALPRCRNWNDLTSALRKQGINTEFKRKGTTSTIEGVKFSKNGYTFSGSKVDKAFSYSKLKHHFAQTQQRVSQQPTPGKRMKMAADNYRSAFSGLFGNNNPSVTQGADMGAYGIIALPPFDSPIKLSATQLQRRAGESPEEHLARVTALLNQVAEAMAVAIEERKRRLRNMKPRKSTLKL